MKSDDMIEEHLGELGRGGRFGTRYEMTHLGESIDKYENAVVPIRDWEIDDKIASDAFPGTSGNRKRSKLTVFEVSRSLASGTEVARRDVFLDVRMDSREIVVAQY